MAKFKKKYDQEMTERLYIRVTPDQKNLLRKAANIANMDISEFFRDIAIDAARILVVTKIGG